MKFLLTEFKEGLIIAFNALRANMLRAVLTTLGIVIGITTVTIMGWLVEGLNNAFLDSLSSLGTDVIYEDKFDWGGGGKWMLYRNRKNITVQQCDMLRTQLTTASAVVPEMQKFSGTLTYHDNTVSGEQVM